MLCYVVKQITMEALLPVTVRYHLDTWEDSLGLSWQHSVQTDVLLLQIVVMKHCLNITRNGKRKILYFCPCYVRV